MISIVLALLAIAGGPALADVQSQCPRVKGDLFYGLYDYQDLQQKPELPEQIETLMEPYRHPFILNSIFATDEAVLKSFQKDENTCGGGFFENVWEVKSKEDLTPFSKHLNFRPYDGDDLPFADGRILYEKFQESIRVRPDGKDPLIWPNDREPFKKFSIMRTTDDIVLFLYIQCKQDKLGSAIIQVYQMVKEASDKLLGKKDIQRELPAVAKWHAMEIGRGSMWRGKNCVQHYLGTYKDTLISFVQRIAYVETLSSKLEDQGTVYNSYQTKMIIELIGDRAYILSGTELMEAQGLAVLEKKATGLSMVRSKMSDQEVQEIVTVLKDSLSQPVNSKASLKDIKVDTEVGNRIIESTGKPFLYTLAEQMDAHQNRLRKKHFHDIDPSVIEDFYFESDLKMDREVMDQWVNILAQGAYPLNDAEAYFEPLLEKAAGGIASAYPREHRSQYGEIIGYHQHAYSKEPPNDVEFAKTLAQHITDDWWDEIVGYDFNTGTSKTTMRKIIGQFAQVVWKEPYVKTNYAVARYETPNHGFFTVVYAKYYPRGNLFDTAERTIWKAKVPRPIIGTLIDNVKDKDEALKLLALVHAEGLPDKVTHITLNMGDNGELIEETKPVFQIKAIQAPPPPQPQQTYTPPPTSPTSSSPSPPSNSAPITPPLSKPTNTKSSPTFTPSKPSGKYPVAVFLI